MSVNLVPIVSYFLALAAPPTVAWGSTTAVGNKEISVFTYCWGHLPPVGGQEERNEGQEVAAPPATPRLPCLEPNRAALNLGPEPQGRRRVPLGIEAEAGTYRPSGLPLSEHPPNVQPSGCLPPEGP
jgi:hypothetical protein